MFQADGQMRVATGKATLKKNLQVEVSQHLITSPTSMVVDVSTLLWTLEWPSQGTVDTFISVFKVWVNARLLEADVHLCFDRYFEYSTKSSTRSARANATRVHQLERKTPLPARDAVLKNSANKKQLNTLLCDAILSDDNFLQHATQNHQLLGKTTCPRRYRRVVSRLVWT
ncbi:hypothetical protein GWK47_039042 [Chionoecetes opilio]|uniref:Uncharacterized protein n=1 Tax=Chionoecetes opilio TaxID=41210 RepID=A0A8J4YRC6_CHIOP|nr:hypothetical protein GWK47_039042 [Chionoecetes opilio]